MNAQDEVLAAENRRAAAWIAGDTAALSACLDDELVYVHATGVQHDREQLLHYLSTGPRFQEMGMQPRSIRIDGEVALVSGELHMRVERASGVQLESRSLVTAEWVRRRDGWRLACFRDAAILTGTQGHPA